VSTPRDVGRRMRAAVLRLWVRWSGRPVGLALVYHLLDEQTGDPDHDLVAPHSFAQFEAHLAHLRRHYRVVLAADLPAAVAARRRGQRPPMAITFDDDSRSHVEHALPRLAAAGMPATFYVMGTTFTGGVGTWWEDLQTLWRRGDACENLAVLADVDPAMAVGKAGLRAVSTAIEVLPAERRDVIAQELRERVGDTGAAAAFGEPQIRALVEAGHEIGFHTLRHYQLTRLDDDELDRALAEGRDAVSAAAGAPLRTIAYPHGRADERVSAAARRHGFTAGFTTDAGRFGLGDDPLRIGRYWPAYGPPAQFEIAVAQLLAGRWGVSVGGDGA
jgi:peptidoglycan/xylan/chitin deacetylase (PgdA/CDA1 family)